MGMKVLKLYGLACLWVLLALGVYVGVFFKMRYSAPEPLVNALPAKPTPPPPSTAPIAPATPTPPTPTPPIVTQAKPT
ncbi:hypothetical protein, partial [Helicobacter sp. L8]|uniref:hypothetical protein n=1 Tax=Helicobacter sp. L8 TaxID=2316078 RepID=UPI001968C679